MTGAQRRAASSCNATQLPNFVVLQVAHVHYLCWFLVFTMRFIKHVMLLYRISYFKVYATFCFAADK